MRASAVPILAAVTLAACGGDGSTAPWLTDPGVDGHAKYLPLVGTAHDPSTHPSITCASCHPATTSSFRQPVCTGCHTQTETTSLHTSAATGTVLDDYSWTPPPASGVRWQRPRCLGCHPQGGVPDLVHDRYFPIGAGTPHDRTCGACHGDALEKENVAQLRCVTCHSSSAVKVRLPGPHATFLRADSYPAAPTAADCLRCHARAQVDRVASHGTRAGPSGFGPAGPWDGVHGTSGGAVNCFACHNARPPSLGGPGPGVPDRPWAQDWSIPASTANQTAATACRGCHGVKP
jgi:hypothetical protein